MTDSRPCPFCGCKTLRLCTRDDAQLYKEWVECEACQARGPTSDGRYEGEREATDLWNQRSIRSGDTIDIIWDAKEQETSCS